MRPQEENCRLQEENAKELKESTRGIHDEKLKKLQG